MKNLILESNSLSFTSLISTLNFQSRYVQPHWNQTTIEGFISKSECQSLLLSKGPGTFMLRFSDSKLGGISTAYAARNEDGSIEVKHLEPDTLKILQVRIDGATERSGGFFRSEVWQTWSKISRSS